MKEWQYLTLVVVIRDGAMLFAAGEERFSLAQLGSAGWEMVSAVSMDEVPVAFFKRPVVEAVSVDYVDEVTGRVYPVRFVMGNN